MSTPYIPNHTVSNVLVTGNTARTGTLVNISGAENNTLYYRFSGNSLSATGRAGIELRDAAGNWGYILDVKSFAGSGVYTYLTSFDNPVNNGIRGYINSISSADTQIYLDSMYPWTPGLTMVYDNKIILGNQPIPLVGKVDNQIRFGNRWSTTSTITLYGVLTGCTYSALLNAKQEVLDVFSKDFQEFFITQNGETLYSQDYNVIRDINFESSKYQGLLNYTVTLESQPHYLFSGYYGVINPVNEWSFQETDNKLLEATHRISAKGFNTSNDLSNAFDNVKTYVLSLAGSNSFISPFFTNYCTGANLCVDTISENINRFENTYEIIEKYILDLYHGGNGYIRYTSEYECNSLGLATLNLNGEVKNCKNTDLTNLRAKYATFNPFSAAVQSYSDACGRTDLNSDYNSYGITEDPYSKKIAFNYSFDNDFNPKTYFDYTTEAKIDETDITTIEIKGTIKSRGELKVRWAQVEAFYSSLNLFTLASQAYSDFGGSSTYPLNPRELSFSVSKNQFLGEINVLKSYSNKAIFSSKFQDLDYTVSVSPGVNKIKSLPLVNIPNTSCSSNYYSVYFGFWSRGQISINGHAIGSCENSSYSSTLTEIKNVANKELLSLYSASNTYLEQNNIIQTNEGHGKGLKFQFGWSMQPAGPINPTPNFDQITTLSLK